MLSLRSSKQKRRVWRSERRVWRSEKRVWRSARGVWKRQPLASGMIGRLPRTFEIAAFSCVLLFTRLLMDDKEELKKRFEDLRQDKANLRKRFDDLRQGKAGLSKRFDDLSKRFDDLFTKRRESRRPLDQLGADKRPEAGSHFLRALHGDDYCMACFTRSHGMTLWIHAGPSAPTSPAQPSATFSQCEFILRPCFGHVTEARMVLWCKETSCHVGLQVSSVPTRFPRLAHGCMGSCFRGSSATL